MPQQIQPCPALLLTGGQGLSLIAPPNAKRRRTIKKVLVEVKFFPFLITGLLFF
jgi:hypothetical protein